MKKLLLTCCLLAGIFSSGICQNSKQLFKEANSQYSSKQFDNAINTLNRLIEADSVYFKAYGLRANCYLQLSSYEKAINDYNKSLTLNPDDYDVLLTLATTYYKVGQYKNAINNANKASNLKAKELTPVLLKVEILIKQQKFEKGLELTNHSMDIKKSMQSYLYRGTIYENLGDTTSAINDYNKAISINGKSSLGYFFLAKTKLHLGEYAEALTLINESISIDPDNSEYFSTRAFILYGKQEYKNAINDASRALLINKNNLSAFYVRAMCYEALDDAKTAKDNYQMVLQQTIEQADSTVYSNSKNRMHELNRETNIPEFTIAAPLIKNDSIIEIPQNKNLVTFRGEVSDESELDAIIINNKSVEFSEENESWVFNSEINIEGTENLTVVVKDVYDNTSEKIFRIIRTEIGLPQVRILAPYENDKSEFLLSDMNDNLFIEGLIKDESQIKTITANGVFANYTPDSKNPKFKVNVSIKGIDTVNLVVVDKYNNKTEKVYALDRSNILPDSPMGKTWVVFIENSKYKNFASLDGAKKDVQLMKQALANYQIHNTIHKKDLSYNQIKSFLGQELKEMVKSNQVRSLIIWYAGHGKEMNNNSYWIPVDGDRDNEHSFFKITELKDLLKSYSSSINHTLIITDACESGPTFYQAMRAAGGTTKDCNNPQVMRFKSSQVFTTAGSELAVDNSQFTRSFATALNSNANSCIPIEDIAKEVSKSAEQNSQPLPKLGLIQGLPHEDGSFIFITK